MPDGSIDAAAANPKPVVDVVSACGTLVMIQI
jgi:hypothetical protein